MIQSGDPSNQGTGTASIFGGKTFDTEISNQLYNIRGALALANTGQASSSSSQFFIVQNSQDMTSQIQDKTKYPQKIIDAYKKGIPKLRRKLHCLWSSYFRNGCR